MEGFPDDLVMNEMKDGGKFKL